LLLNKFGKVKSLLTTSNFYKSCFYINNPNLTDSTNEYSSFTQKTRCIGTVPFGKMKNVKNQKTHERTLNCMKKTEA